jgi:hypothetical protein
MRMCALLRKRASGGLRFPLTKTYMEVGNSESAGINRHVVGDERALQGKCKSKHILDTLNPQRHLIGKFSGSKYSCLRPRRITAG